MFDSLIESRRDRKPFWRPATVAVAIGLHAAALLTILVQNFLGVPAIGEPPVQVTFAQVAPPPPPPPPPAPKPAAPKVVPKVEIAMPTEMVQPVATPEEVKTEPIPEPVVTGGEPGGVEGGVPGGTGTAPLPEEPAGPIRVGGDVSAPEAISQPPPEYPALARSARVAGVVTLEAIIHRDGSVSDIRVVKGLRMGCTEAAVEALERWRFKPAMRKGEPVDVYYELTIQFKLI